MPVMGFTGVVVPDTERWVLETQAPLYLGRDLRGISSGSF